MDFAYLRAKFWDEKLWLPEGVTWKTLESKDPNVLYPKASELYITPLIGLVLIVARYFFENYIADPIGRYIGVRSVQYKVVPNATLEGLYKKYGKSSIPHKEITGTAKQLDWTEMKVHRWLRKRRLQNAPTNMKKFRECSYQFVFYSISAVCGLVFMWDKSWFWETKQCWENWPYHPISSGTYWYYMIEMGFYFSLLFTCLMDSKRKDFYEMTLHHFMTLFLMGFSWSINFSHIGTLVLIVHDVSDPWMQIAKMTKYARMQNVCEVLFAIFAVLWILSRVVYYPLWLLNTCLVELPAAIKVSPVIAIFQGVMVLLQILHIIWTYYILRVVSQRFTHGELTHDTRSDSNSITESEEEVDGRPGGDNSNNCSNDRKKVN